MERNEGIQDNIEQVKAEVEMTKDELRQFVEHMPENMIVNITFGERTDG